MNSAWYLFAKLKTSCFVRETIVCCLFELFVNTLCRLCSSAACCILHATFFFAKKLCLCLPSRHVFTCKKSNCVVENNEKKVIFFSFNIIASSKKTRNIFQLRNFAKSLTMLHFITTLNDIIYLSTYRPKFQGKCQNNAVAV